MDDNLRARIFREAKSAMQSGKARSGRWMLSFTAPQGIRHDPLTGWLGSGDTQGQITLAFPTEAAAVDYATRNGIAYEVEPPRDRTLKLQAYADNFR